MDEASENKEKKASISAGAVIRFCRYPEICVRKTSSLLRSFCRRFEARSITAAWRCRRARSSGVRFGSVRLSPSISAVGGCDGGGAADAGGAAEVEGPPAARGPAGVEVEFEFEFELDDDDS